MTVTDLVKLVENKLQALNRKLAILETEGAVDSILKLNLELEETESTLNQLKGLN
jgi:prefoldin subunit 5